MNMRADDIPEVSEESFRYPGPRPQTKEAALLNLADSIESASRMAREQEKILCAAIKSHERLRKL